MPLTPTRARRRLLRRTEVITGGSIRQNVRMSENEPRWVWPSKWQPEVRDIPAPLVGGDDRVDLLVGDPATSHSGTRYVGYVYAENGQLMLIHDHSGRSDVTHGGFQLDRSCAWK